MDKPIKRWEDAGRQLESLDVIEEAIALLKTSNLNWLLLVGTHQHASTIHSDLCQQSANMLDDWNENGTLQEDIRRHLEPLL